MMAYKNSSPLSEGFVAGCLNRLPCPSLSDWFIQAGGQAGTTLSLTVAMSNVGCFTLRTQGIASSLNETALSMAKKNHKITFS
jgi:hypothetical protein